MSELYNLIETLCKEKGTNITGMCKAAKISRAPLTELKMGRSKTLSSATLSKIAAYFGVSVDYLLGNTDEKESPVAKNDGASDDDIKFALFGGAPVTDAQFEEVKRFAKYIAERGIHARDD